MAKQKQICFRVIGGYSYGIGHIVRSSTLADMLRKELGDSCNITFFTNGDEVVLAYLQREGIGYYIVPSSMSFREEIQFVRKNISSRPEVLLTDFLSISYEQQKYYKDYAQNLICLDDLGGLKVCADAVVNGQFLDGMKEYQPDSHAKLFLGAKYMIMKPEYFVLNRKKKVIPNSAEKILIAMGGGDPEKLSVRILKAISGIKNISVTVVLGPACEITDAEVRAANPKVVLKRDVTDLHKHIFEADLGIITGGFTKYEFAAIGTPTVIIASVEHQDYLAKAFARQGLSKYLGYHKDISDSFIRESVREMLSNGQLRKEFSQNGKRLVDGKGIDRVCEIVCSYLK